ncbi:RNA polymerase sigma-70 factor [Ornithinimicrobium cryptoxanthini]|uniref:RNA polymerase sigma-70 factor n=1 Tax=Ornithinimicrobium cryptoxanthini TaxID=2934161 RepID=UPI0021194DDE|nr:RNA polymerase sigma-70 factor [Ornithinimicrobium cryptoxanthini]
MTDASLEAFQEQRHLLFTVAYQMLFSAADAEDVVQEVWLRWSQVDLATVRDPRSYLVRIATRQALNRIRTMQRRRESYVGPWLPEPLLTAPDVAEDVELADSVSTAMLMVLESLSPTERAVFILREVFGFEYAEIAAATDKSPAAVRQVASRAGRAVRAQRPEPVPTEQTEEVLRRFLAAAGGGDLKPLLELLAPDVVLFTDGGGLRQAALRPIHGADKVLRFLDAVFGNYPGQPTLDLITVNGQPGLRLFGDGVLDTVASVRIEAGLVTALYLVRNPDKLTRAAGTPTRLDRGR